MAGERVTLPGERQEITLDSKMLSRYVGAYQMPDAGPVMLIALCLSSTAAAQDEAAALWSALRAGGHVALIRHAGTVSQG